MSCGPAVPTFRLLDGFTGWEPADATGLTGLDGTDGISLAAVVPGALDPAALSPHLPPAWLARGCGRCSWYLVPPAPRSCLLVRDACHESFCPIHSCDALHEFVAATAVATRHSVVAVSDGGADEVLVFGASGRRLLARINRRRPGPLAIAPWGEVLVVEEGSRRLWRYSLGGDVRGRFRAPLPAGVERIRAGTVDEAGDGRCRSVVWVVTNEHGTLRLWQAGRNDGEFRQVAVHTLTASTRSALTTFSDAGFCLSERTADGATVERCYGRDGCAAAEPPPQLRPTARVRAGQLLTLPLDSGVPRCRWHRVRIDADVPPGTLLAVSVATSEEESPVAQGTHGGSIWSTFPAGVPHSDDWQNLPSGQTDVLVVQPPGRYLFVRVRLGGDGRLTPVLRRIRLDFPRSTSLEYLPPNYREDPDAEDFTERFLARYDATIEDLDDHVRRFPALLDAAHVAGEVLPWLGSLLDIAFDSSWDVPRRQRILAEAPELFRRRGTVAGLRAVLRLVFDVDAAIDETAARRAWGAAGRARLGEVRLFGRARARFKLAASSLGSAPLRSHGNPDLDPHDQVAFRFRVLLPPPPDGGGQRARAQLLDNARRLVDAQKPAHTQFDVRVGGSGYVVGIWGAAGVDTALVPLDAPVLGRAGNVRLRRTSIVWGRRGGPAGPFVVGAGAAAGLTTAAY